MKRAWLIIGDIISFWVSFLAIIYIRFGGFSSEIAVEHIIPFLILCISWILVFYLFGLYDIINIKPTIPHLKRFGLAILVAFTIGIILFYSVQIFGISPKTNLLLEVSGFSIISFLFRRLFYNIYAKQISKQTILVGKKDHLDELYNILNSNPQIGLSVIYYTQDINEALSKYSDIKNSIFIVDTESNKISGEKILNIYKNKNEILNIAEAYEEYLYKIPVEYISTSWIVENINIKKDIFYALLTFIIDKIVALLILIVSSPVLVIAIVARILEDGRPVFYKQERVGINRKIFKLYKLRSMIVLSPDGSAENGEAKWSTGQDDPRITKLGKILRKTHIDEIPQMINVIKGDISLVGPRPERPEFVSQLEKSIPHYNLRHIIRPGFTGWAQIKYHYAKTVLESKEKLEYDLYYVKNKNIFIDFGILLRTIQIIFTH